MEKITKYFTFDYDKDTTIEYVNTGLYSTLNCSYTSEDPDYGTDTLHYNAEPAVSIGQMAYELLGELKPYLDKKDKGNFTEISFEERMEFGEYSNSTLYAIEHALKPIADEYRVDQWFDSLYNSCLKIAKQIIKDGVKLFSFCDTDDNDCERYSPEEYEHIGEAWFGIKRLDSIFDNQEYEYIVAVGYYGGGNFQTAYIYGDQNNESYIVELANAIREAIMKITDLKPTSVIYVTKEKEDK